MQSPFRVDCRLSALLDYANQFYQPYYVYQA
jgi:hypothetical protein